MAEAAEPVPAGPVGDRRIQLARAGVVLVVLAQLRRPEGIRQSGAAGAAAGGPTPLTPSAVTAGPPFTAEAVAVAVAGYRRATPGPQAALAAELVSGRRLRPAAAAVRAAARAGHLASTALESRDSCAARAAVAAADSRLPAAPADVAATADSLGAEAAAEAPGRLPEPQAPVGLGALG